MSTIQDGAPYQLVAVNTYPQTVSFTIYIKGPTGQPMPGPSLTMAPTTVQNAGSGEVMSVSVTYPPPTGGTPTTISIPYGAPIDLTRTLNILWNTSPESQVIVIVQTGTGEI